MKIARGFIVKLRIGIAFAVLAVLIGLAVNAVWGEVYGRYDWRVMAIAIMLIGVMLLASLDEFLRPPNPYKHLDPRFSFLDAGPTGTVYSTSSSVLWNVIPPLIVCAALVLSLLV